MAVRYANDVWEQIRSEYRSGALSVRELAKKYGPNEAAIRYRARKGDNGKPWERDLTEDVRAATRAKQARAELGPGASPTEIIEAASTRNFQAIQGHMKRLGKLAELEDRILTTIERSFVDYEAVAEAESVADRVQEAMSAEKHSLRVMRMSSVLNPELTRSGLLKNITRNYADLTAAAAKRIQLERQALNLDKPEDADKDVEGFVFEAYFGGETAHA